MVLVAAALAAGPAGAEGEAGPLAQKVNYQLNQADVVNQSAIVVRAEGQRVVLEGRVRSQKLIDKAGRIAADVDGVKTVDNRLKVADAPSGGGSGGTSHLPKGEPAEAVTPDQDGNQQDTKQQPDNESGQGGSDQGSD